MILLRNVSGYSSMKLQDCTDKLAKKHQYGYGGTANLKMGVRVRQYSIIYLLYIFYIDIYIFHIRLVLIMLIFFFRLGVLIIIL